MKKKMYRLKKGYEIKRIIKKGTWKSGKRVIVYIYNNNLNYNRMAVCVSKKNGNSVSRNTLKRYVREAHRNILKNNNIRNKDFVIILKKEFNFKNVKYIEIYEDLVSIYESI